MVLFFKQKTAYEVRISDWSSDVCSSDLVAARAAGLGTRHAVARIAVLGHPIGRGRPGEAGPARSRIVFVGAVEQGVAAARAPIAAVGLVVVVAARKRRLGPGLAPHMILGGRQPGAPFGLGKREMIHDGTFRLWKQIGRASCRERGGQDVEITGGSVLIKK